MSSNVLIMSIIYSDCNYLSLSLIEYARLDYNGG